MKNAKAKLMEFDQDRAELVQTPGEKAVEEDDKHLWNVSCRFFTNREALRLARFIAKHNRMKLVPVDPPKPARRRTRTP